MTKSKVKKMLAVFISFVLYICLACLIISVILKISVLNSDFVKQCADISDYVTSCIEKAEHSLVSYGMASGFDEEFFDGIVSEERINKDFKQYVDYIYEDRQPEYNFDEFINKKFVENIKNRGIVIDAQGEEALKNLTKICNEAYLKSFEIPFGDSLKTYISLVNNNINFIFIVLSALAVACIVIIFFLQKRRNYYKYYVYSLTATIGTILIPVFVIEYQNRITNLGIDDKGLYYLINQISKDIINKNYLFIFILLIIDIICFGLGYHRKHIKFKR